jgi:hypothetical protein
MRGCAKSRLSDMVNNGWVEPASSVPASTPATEPTPAKAPEPDAAEAPAEDEPTAGSISPEGSAAAAQPAREGRSLKDMALSLAVLIVPIALLLIFYRVVLSGDAPVTVDPAPTIKEAQAVFPVAVPTGLGDDWHVSTATFRREATGATLRLGYVDPDKDPVQLVESTVPAATLLPAELTASAKPLGNFRAPTGVWRIYNGRPGEQALVLGEQSRTIIVVGKTDVKNLEELVTSLS